MPPNICMLEIVWIIALVDFMQISILFVKLAITPYVIPVSLRPPIACLVPPPDIWRVWVIAPFAPYLVSLVMDPGSQIAQVVMERINSFPSTILVFRLVLPITTLLVPPVSV